MGLRESITRALAPLGAEQRTGTWGELNAFFDQIKNGTADVAGKRVTPDTAMSGTAAVHAAVGLLAETIGSLPLLTYQRQDDRNRLRVAAVPVRWPGSLARMLHDGPNPEMSGQEYWENVEGHVCLWGNHYSYIVRDGFSGRPTELWPLDPSQMEVFRDNDARGLPRGKRRYVYTTPDGQKVGLNRSSVFHVMDSYTDGVKGISRIQRSLVVGIEQAAAEYAGRFFGQSAVPGGIITSPRPMSGDQVTTLRSTWQAIVGGLDRAQRVAILHSGMDYKTLGIPPKDAQFLELRKFQVAEIARLFRIPLHMLDETAATTWGSGIEQMTIAFVVYTLRSHLRRIETAISRDLGDPDAGRTLLDENLYAEFKVDGLMRGDMAARSAFYASGIQNGWLTREDVRAFENLDPIAGLDKPFVPATMNVLGEEPPPAPEPQPDSLQQQEP